MGKLLILCIFVLGTALACTSITPPLPSVDRCKDIDEDYALLKGCELSKNCTYSYQDLQQVIGRVAACAYTPPPVAKPKVKT